MKFATIFLNTSFQLSLCQGHLESLLILYFSYDGAQFM